MNRLILAMISLLAMTLTAPADDANAELMKKPQWQRMLTGADAKKATELKQQIDAAKQERKTGEALKRAEELLAFRSRLQGEDHWEVRDVKNQIEELKRPVLTMEQEKMREEAERLNAEVEDLYRKGKRREAIPLAEKVNKIRKEILGDKHRDTAIVLHNLALLYQSQGRYAEAEPLLLEALKIRRESLGDQHQSAATSLNTLASLYHSQGKLKEAEQTLLDCALSF